MFRAFVISIVLHLIVLVSPQYPDRIGIVLPAGKASVLGATLRQQAALSNTTQGGGLVAYPHSESTMRAPRAIDRRYAKIPFPSPLDSSASNLVAAEPKTVEARPIASSEASDISAQGEREYRLNLSREARKFKQYPQEARERAWEGVVVVLVAMSLGATIPVVTLKHSSGHDELDRQALEMMQAATKQAALPLGMQGRRFEISLPIEYRLGD